jgi:hypothetical protein
LECSAESSYHGCSPVGRYLALSSSSAQLVAAATICLILVILVIIISIVILVIIIPLALFTLPSLLSLELAGSL